ncbi:MAG: DUF350 domain-containing protein [Bacteroidales bacterium]|nr:DUF350 domain-containing protein [Bacteroidales bacterium]
MTDTNIDFILEPAIYLAVTFVMFVIGKYIYQLFHPKINVKSELVIEDNFAFAIAHTGYLIGLLIAIGSAIVGPSHGIIIDIIDIVVYGSLAIILLNLSTIINDKLILNKFDVRKEIIEDRNEGTGAIEAASAIGAGLIIYGSVSGETDYLLFGIMTSLVFWVIGQFIMILTAKVYNLITSYDVHEHIEKDNVAVGIGFAGAFIAISNLIRFSLMGDFIDWETSFIKIGLYVSLGFVFLLVTRFIADKVLLPGQNLKDELINQEKPNIGAGLIEAFAYIGGSVLITWVL